MDAGGRMNGEAGGEGLAVGHRLEAVAELCAGRRVLALAERGSASERLEALAAELTFASEPSALEEDDAVGYELIFVEALERLPERERALTALGRLAAKGARLIVSSPSGPGPDPLDGVAGLPATRTVRQFDVEASILIADGEAERVEQLTLGDPGRPARVLALVGFTPEELAGHAGPSVRIAARDESRVAALERANRELRRANARLARSQLGVADAAAATQLLRWRQDGGFFVERVAIVLARPVLPLIRAARRIGSAAPEPVRRMLLPLLEKLRSRGG